MEIKLEGFKCYVENIYTFPKKGTTLLTGKSGQGKTTILQAISWALYGSMRGIYNNANLTKKCAVTLKYGDIIIYRQKRPELLKVTVNGKTYENQVAQEVINRNFCPKEIWYTCCYIKQKERCALLSGSNSDRMEILNKLSFQDEDPEQYIQKINEQYNKIEKEFLTLQSALYVKLELFEKDINNKPLQTNVQYKSVEDLAIIKENILEEQKNIEKYEKKVYEYHQLSGVSNHLNKEISTLNKKLENLEKLEKLENKLPIISEEEYRFECARIEGELEKASNVQEIRKKVSACKDKISEIQNNIKKLENDTKEWKDNYDRELSREFLWDSKNIESEYLKGKKECENLDVEYKQDTINNKISEIQKVLSETSVLEKNLETYLKYLSTKKQCDLLNDENMEDMSLDAYEKEEQELNLLVKELKKGRDVQNCPHCNGAVKYVHGKIVVDDHKPVDESEIKNTTEKHKNVIQKIQRLKKYITIKQQCDTLLSLCGNIEQLEEYRNNPINVKDLNKRLMALSKIKCIENVEIPYKICENLYERQNLIKELKEYEKELQEYPEMSENINEKEIQGMREKREMLEKFKREYMKHEETENQENQIKSLLKSFNEKLENIKLDHTCVKLLENSRENVKHMAKEHEDLKYTFEMIDKHRELTDMRTKLVGFEEDMVALGQLKTSALEIECIQLEDTVETINIIMNEMLSSFFMDPITVTLKLHKQLKTKNRKKREVNLKILYKGSEYDSVNQLSGGEGDRVSLALILALNNVVSSPLLLLDECMTAFDQTLREMAIQTLKTNISKNIICVDHGGVDGFYDNIICI